MANRKNRKLIHAAVTTQNIISIILLSLIAIVTLSFSIAILLRNAALRKENEAYRAQLDSIQEEGYYTVSETDTMVKDAYEGGYDEAKQEVLDTVREQLESGTSITSTVRSMFPDQILIAKDGRYYFIPIDKSLALNSFTDTDFAKNDSGILEYEGSNAAVLGTLGLDVSKFQGEIDWESVADAGVEYAFIRVGNRGTSTGKIVEDEYFKANIEGAIKAGIEVGVYFYSSAINEDEALEEAKFVLDAIEPYEVTYPVVIDIERPDSADYRTQSVSQDEMTDIALKFCDTVKGAGYTPMIYGNNETFALILDMSRLEGIDKWVAFYGVPLYFPYEFTIWQYSAAGKIDGIKGEVDLNICVQKGW
ncbi:Glycosyl hydrolases family 25 [Butyrivibrio fibrisolvens DSM 3071]|uniref:Glycosyl hydrolases family 25 n=1 Tax=Butyrivibrio fibrisolvens DSM 3071 TaxID=1121131 RepID=A0A1M5TAY2_BUTFI|nr:glycoside hydrolase family 25 protein [Butyrivibrio fibrisolvens]SHH47884.1 Glycosyl hydrolases family 25 [Butyrivibrio fibrisolvens DSM 3071]